MIKGKKHRENEKLVDKTKKYSIEEAISILKKVKKAKFDETVELSIHLNVDPRKSDQMVRGTVVLPYGTGKKKVVAVIAKGDKVEEAKKAGADIVDYNLINEIQKGKINFDVLVTTPDCMRDISKLGRILGTRGLMPNPKAGTVTFDIGDAVKNIKKGQIQFRVDSYGIIHSPVGKISFPEEHLKKNIHSLIESVIRLKPSSVKGVYIKSIALSSTMGPGIKINSPQV